MAKKIYFCRHGETDYNKQCLNLGATNVPMNSNGLNQVRKLAKRLADIKFDKIYSSPLARALQTSQEIAKQQDCIVSYLDDLKERDFGEFEGAPQKDLVVADTRFNENPENEIGYFVPLEGESHAQCLERIKPLLDAILASDDETILISAHGSINKNIRLYLMGESFEDRLDMDQSNACLNMIFVDNDGNRTLKMFNDTSHIPIKRVVPIEPTIKP